MAIEQRITMTVVYLVHHGDGSGSYAGEVVYTDFDELARQLKEALDAGREVLVERQLMTDDELADCGEEFPDGYNPLLGEPPPVTVTWPDAPGEMLHRASPPRETVEALKDVARQLGADGMTICGGVLEEPTVEPTSLLSAPCERIEPEPKA